MESISVKFQPINLERGRGNRRYHHHHAQQRDERGGGQPGQAVLHHQVQLRQERADCHRQQVHQPACQGHDQQVQVRTELAFFFFTRQQNSPIPAWPDGFDNIDNLL